MNTDEKKRVMGILKIWNRGEVTDDCLEVYIAYLDDLPFSDVKDAIADLSRASQRIVAPSEVRIAAVGRHNRRSPSLGAPTALGAHDKF